MNRRLTAFLAAPLLAVTLSSCTVVGDVVDQFGPRPSAAVLDLARQAQADAEADSPAAGLRGDHADELFAEVERLCGVDDRGEAPESCAVEETSGEAVAVDEAAALDGYLEALPRVPDESVDLVVSQAVEVAALPSSPELPDPPGPLEAVSDADAETLRGLLAGEHAAVYALAAAQAYLDDEGDARVAELIDAHEQRIAALTRTLEPTGDVPAAAPGYVFDGVAPPVDEAEARQFVNRVAADTDLAWRAAAAGATAREAREWLIALAGHAAKAAQLHAF